MPSEIRTPSYPSTAFDLLAPPAAANPRGEAPSAFDSLLRAITPVDRSAASSPPSDDAYRPAPAPHQDPPRDDRESSSAAGSPSAAANSSAYETDTTPRSDDRPAASNERSSAENSPAPEQAKAGQGGEAGGAAQTDTASPARPAKGADEPTDETTGEGGEELVKVDAGDPTALQAAALAAQVPLPVQPEVLPTTEVAVVEPLAGEQPTAEGVPASSVRLEPTDSPVSLEGQLDPKSAASEPAATETSTTVSIEDQLVAAKVIPVDPATPQPDGEIVDQAADTNKEQPVISQLKSRRTDTSDGIFHETLPKQGDAAPSLQVDEAASEPAAESATEQADAAMAGEISPAPLEKAGSDAQSGHQQERKSDEASSTAQSEPVPQASFESVATELAPPETPPAETAPQAVRVDHGPSEASSHQQQAPHSLVDPHGRPGAAPRLAAEVLAGHSREANHARPVEIDSARFLTRVARAFTAAQQRGGEVQMRLSPPELGSLRVEIKVLDGVMTARVETENSAARTAVLEHLPQLRERLAEQGVRIERFDVDLMQNGSSGTPDRPTDRQPEDPMPRRGPVSRTNSVRGQASETRATVPGIAGNGGLNVIV